MKTKFELKRIGLKTLDRSGSNLILALFHYHPEFFSLTEKFVFDTTDYESIPVVRDSTWMAELCPYTGPLQRRAVTGLREVDDNAINLFLESINPSKFYIRNPRDDHELTDWLHKKNFSMFNGTDNDTKNIEKVKNLVIKEPKEYIWNDEEHREVYKNAAGIYCDLKYVDHKYDKKIYLIRNPFRIAMSLRPWEAHRKPKDALHLKQIADQMVNFVSNYKADIEKGLDSKIIFLEYFLKNYEEEMPKLLTWADPDTEPNCSRSLGKHFASSTPNFRGVNYGIKGIQGFDPCLDIDHKRTMNRNILEYFTTSPLRNHELLSYVQNKLGPIAFDYWFHDIRHDYNSNLSLDDINKA